MPAARAAIDVRESVRTTAPPPAATRRIFTQVRFTMSRSSTVMTA
ncbi:hypothetical protein ACFPRL_23455 [Pseudoclavibacter helvolus]